MTSRVNEWVIAVSWLVLAACVVAWPLAVVWFAKDEPPLVVSLGFLGLIIPQVGVLLNAYVKRDVES